MWGSQIDTDARDVAQNDKVTYSPLKEDEKKKEIAFIAIATVKIPKAIVDDGESLASISSSCILIVSIEWSITLLLFDPSTDKPQTILITNEREALVPNVVNGDVILLRNVHVCLQSSLE